MVPGATTHAWSPDGRQLVYTHWDPEQPMLHVLDLESRTSRPLTRGQHPVWSPDDNLIAFLEGNDAACTIRPDGTELRLVVEQRRPPGLIEVMPQSGLYGVIWAPDDSALLLARRDRLADEIDLILHPLDGTPPINLTAGFRGSAIPVVWLPQE